MTASVWSSRGGSPCCQEEITKTDGKGQDIGPVYILSMCDVLAELDHLC